jgi:hypothetical protein
MLQDAIQDLAEGTVMPKLHVIYDPMDKVICNPEIEKQFNIKSAHLATPDNLNEIDIYNLAKRLAELLLEQL